ncbi:peptidoglycan-associated lipoprotein Pal [Chitinimonas sp.]|uniref:peptidoglycan-associated lipoprotein Pal n=1 Tax=Chitinimonas sp. TaxID=1934313 RepID=UPI0035B3C7FE
MNQKVVVSLLLAGLLAACASTPPAAPAAQPATETKPATPAAVDNTNTKPLDQGSNGKLDPLKDPANILSKRSVYFDYDKYDIRDDQRAVVEAHGRYLAANGSRSVRVEGNTDERGSREYNLALGQKRAEAVRKALTVLGAKDSQVEATSNGKEKPRASGHDEAAWTENRRGDVVYNGE